MRELLRQLRERNGLSMAQAAEKLCVQRQTVWAWEAGDKEPDKVALRKIVEVYGPTEEERDSLARLRAFGTDDPAQAAS